MKRWLITAGYVTAFRLSAESWRGSWWRKAADLWCGFFYRHYCPYPTLKDNWTARACVEGGCCGCENQRFYSVVAPAEHSGGAR